MTREGRVVLVRTATHGRVLVDDAGASSNDVLVGCHGYGQNAAIMLEELRRVRGTAGWRLVSVQGLHRFYTRGDQVVVASWMTREDREQAIADNIEYLNRALEAAGCDDASRIVFMGFSQGASMAARAAVRGAHRAAGLVLLGGDIPPDAREGASVEWPPVLIGCGDADAWYGARIDGDLGFLRGRDVPHEVVRFAGGHEFTAGFRQAAVEWLARRFRQASA